jgi:hypothetical protein
MKRPVTLAHLGLTLVGYRSFVRVRGRPVHP